MNLKSKVFEKSVEMDLCVSTFGKYISSNYNIEEKVIENKDVQIYQIKSLKDDLVYLLEAFPKKKKKISMSSFLPEETVDRGESQNYIYIIKKT
ncbi:MAG: hypothetical protein IBX70_13885 [Clostridia bacterium]|nr:hypothetical protein [Clostridia bacterium]